MWTPVRISDGRATTRPYGFGWFVEDVNGHRVIRRNGQTAGFAASIQRYPQDRLAVIVLCNLGTIGIAGEIASGIAEIYVPALHQSQRAQ